MFYALPLLLRDPDETFARAGVCSEYYKRDDDDRDDDDDNDGDVDG